MTMELPLTSPEKARQYRAAGLWQDVTLSERFLAQAEREHWPALLWARTLPELDPLRNDPRFADLLRALNLSR